MFFLWKVSNPGHWHQKLQEDWLGTKDEIGSSNVHLYNSNLHLDLVPQEIILVTAPKLQEDEIGTLTGNVDIPLPGAERINPGHGTKIARGEGGTEVISISLCLYLVSSLVP